MLRVALLTHVKDFTVTDEISFALTDAFVEAGASVRPVASVLAVTPDQDDVLLIMASPFFFPNIVKDLTRLRRMKAPQGTRVLVFLWHYEPLPDPGTPRTALFAHLIKGWLSTYSWGRQHLGVSRGSHFAAICLGNLRHVFDKIFVYTQRKTEFLESQGISAEYLPMGHHRIWGSLESDAVTERDIDVLFLGHIFDNRRGRVVTQVKEGLARAGVEMKTLYDFNEHGLWGEQRTRLIQRTKIFLCVYQHALDSSGMRLSLGMGNGALVVSEPVADASPFVPGQHFVEAPVESLAETILFYLRDAAARQRIIASASDMLRREFTMVGSARHIIACAQEQKQQHGL